MPIPAATCGHVAPHLAPDSRAVPPQAGSKIQRPDPVPAQRFARLPLVLRTGLSRQRSLSVVIAPAVVTRKILPLVPEGDIL